MENNNNGLTNSASLIPEDILNSYTEAQPSPYDLFPIEYEPFPYGPLPEVTPPIEPGVTPPIPHVPLPEVTPPIEPGVTPPTLGDPVEPVTTPVLPDHDPGWNFTNAYDLGAINGSLTVQEAVNGSDQIDLYQFSVDESGEYIFTLDELSADVDMNLYSSYGELLDDSFNIGTISESININLDSGNYFAEVISYDLMDSNYELTIAEDNSIV